MAEYTPNLNLLKKDPLIDGNDTFNIKTMLNDNWDKIDEKVATKEDLEQIEVPVKSVNGKTGDVQLTAADIGAETPAGAQAKADAALAGANTYTDQEVGEVAQALNDAQSKINTHANVTASLSTLGHVKYAVLTATLNTSWSGSSAPYSKTVTVSGILATDTPIIDIVMSGTYSTDEARIEAWGYIYRAVTANGSITFYATEKPTVSLPIQIKVVR